MDDDSEGMVGARSGAESTMSRASQMSIYKQLAGGDTDREGKVILKKLNIIFAGFHIL
jgi:hypothetical protein